MLPGITAATVPNTPVSSPGWLFHVNPDSLQVVSALLRSSKSTGPDPEDRNVKDRLALAIVVPVDGILNLNHRYVVSTQPLTLDALRSRF
jgi:hypothetical protein